MVCRTSLCGVATTLAWPSWKPRAVLGILNVSFHRGFLERKPRAEADAASSCIFLSPLLFPLPPYLPSRNSRFFPLLENRCFIRSCRVASRLPFRAGAFCPIFILLLSRPSRGSPTAFFRFPSFPIRRREYSRRLNRRKGYSRVGVRFSLFSFGNGSPSITLATE